MLATFLCQIRITWRILVPKIWSTLVRRLSWLCQVLWLLTGHSEVLEAGVYNDISVAQWLGLTPKRVVKDHLGFSDDTLNRLPQVKPFILPGDKNLTATSFTRTSE